MNNQNQMQAAPAQEPQIDEREAELSRREEEVRRRELRAAAIEALTEERMPTELCELLDYSSEEAFKASLEKVRRIWAQAVQKAVESRVAGGAPKAGGTHAEGTLRDAIAGYYNK